MGTYLMKFMLDPHEMWKPETFLRAEGAFQTDLHSKGGIAMYSTYYIQYGAREILR